MKWLESNPYFSQLSFRILSGASFGVLKNKVGEIWRCVLMEQYFWKTKQTKLFLNVFSTYVTHILHTSCSCYVSRIVSHSSSNVFSISYCIPFLNGWTTDVLCLFINTQCNFNLNILFTFEYIRLINDVHRCGCVNNLQPFLRYYFELILAFAILSVRVCNNIR